MKNKLNKLIGTIFLVLTVITLFAAFSVSAEEMTIPAKLQAALFKKIFLFDKTLKDAETVNILIVYQGKVPAILEELKTEFEAAELSVISVELEKIASKIDEASVVYVFPNVETETVTEICTEKDILSISGIAEFVEAGKVSVGLGSEGGKPKIIINLNQADAENHEFSADLLKLAKVIK